MEIKTCEEYVLNELAKSQKEVDHLKDTVNDLSHCIDVQNEKIDYLTSVLDAVGKAIRIVESDDNSMKISFNSSELYPWYDERKPFHDLVYTYFKSRKLENQQDASGGDSVEEN